jgi:LAO/AO transport system kinase
VNRIASPEELAALRSTLLAARDPNQTRITVCGGTGCRANGSMELAAEQSVTDYRKALMFMHPRAANWEVPVEACSALKGDQTQDIWGIVQKFKASRDAEGLTEQNRAAQAKNWMWNEIRNGLVERLKANPEVAARVKELEEAVTANKLSPTTAADELMDLFAGK